MAHDDMTNEILIGLVLDEESLLTITEICSACQVQTEWVVELVDEGILEPTGETSEHWNFSGISLQRARKVKRLQQDLGLNTAGAALVLELIDENERLRAQLCR